MSDRTDRILTVVAVLALLIGFTGCALELWAGTSRTTITIDAPAGTCIEVVTDGTSVYTPAGCEHAP